jgi:hypothetical protein
MAVLVLCAAAVWNITAQEGDFEIEDGVLVKYRGNAAELVVPEGVTAIGEGAFAECGSLLSITLPAGLTAVGKWAFFGCYSLSSVILPAGLTTIGDGAFAGCGSLLSVTLPASLTSIGMVAFAECGSLLSITLPEGLTRIGEWAFDMCYDLESITLLSPMPPALDEDDPGIEDETVICVPAASVEVYRNAEGWKNYADRIQAESEE